MFRKKRLFLIILTIAIISFYNLYAHADNTLFSSTKPAYKISVNGSLTNAKSVNVEEDIYIGLEDLVNHTSLSANMEIFLGKKYVHITIPSLISMKKIDGKDYVDLTHYNKMYNSKAGVPYAKNGILPYTMNLTDKYGVINMPNNKYISFNTKLINGQNYVDIDTFKNKIYPITLDMIIANDDIINHQLSTQIFNYSNDSFNSLNNGNIQMVVNNNYITLNPLEINGKLYISTKDLEKYMSIYSFLNEKTNTINLIDSSRLSLLEFDGNVYIDLSHYKSRYNEDLEDILSKGYIPYELPYIMQITKNANNSLGGQLIGYNIKQVGYQSVVDMEVFEEDIYPYLLNIIIENEKFVKKNETASIPLYGYSISRY